MLHFKDLRKEQKKKRRNRKKGLVEHFERNEEEMSNLYLQVTRAIVESRKIKCRMRTSVCLGGKEWSNYHKRGRK